MKFEYIFHTEPFSGDNLVNAPQHIYVGGFHHSASIPSNNVITVNSHTKTLTGAVLSDTERLYALMPAESNPVIHLPADPDEDICIAVYLLKYYAESGRMPKAAPFLAEYTEKLRNGNVAVSAESPYTFSFVMAILKKMLHTYSPEEKSYLLLQKSEILIKRALINYLLNPYYDLASAPIASDEPLFFTDINNALLDYGYYKNDLNGTKDKKPVCETYTLSLPLSDTFRISDHKIKFITWTAPPTCRMPDFWANLDGYALVMLPEYGLNNEKAPAGGTNRIKIILSNRLLYKPAASFTLYPLIYLLELCEQARENESGAVKRRMVPAGIKNGQVKPFSVTEDPWQIQTEQFTQSVFSPSGGTLMSTRDIIDFIVNAEQCKAVSAFFRIILPFSFPAGDDRLILRQLKKSAWKAEKLPYTAIDYSTQPQPTFYIRSNSELNLKNEIPVFTSGNLNLILYKNGSGILFLDISPDIDGTYSYSAFNKLLNLKQQLLSTGIGVFVNSLTLPDLPCIQYEPLLVYTALTAENSFQYSQSSLLQSAYSMACSEFTFDKPTQHEYMLPNSSMAAVFSDSGCSLISSADKNTDKIITAYKNDWFFLYASIIQRRTVLKKLCLTLSTLSPIHYSKIKETGRQLLCLDNLTLVLSSPVFVESDEFFTKGLDYYRITELSQDTQKRYTQLYQFIKQQVVSLGLLVFSFLLPMLIVVFAFSVSLISLKPLLSFSSETGKMIFNGSLSAVFAWLGVLCFIGLTGCLILKLIKSKYKK